MARIHTEGLGLRVEQDGRGPDVLLIGGVAQDASVWNAQLPDLVGAHRVTRYDPRGFGGSATPPGPYSLADLTADAVAVLDGAGIAGAHVVGSSLGAVIAQRLAVEHPARVHSLTLSGGWATPDRALRSLLSGWLWTAAHAASREELLAVVDRWSFTAATWNAGRGDEYLARAAELEAREGGRDAWARFRDAFRWTVWAALQRDAGGPGRIRAPSLVLAGDEDIVAGRRHAEELAARLSDARLEVVEDAGHHPFIEQPRATNDVLLRFLTADTAATAR